jgi:hypothetical protein
MVAAARGGCILFLAGMLYKKTEDTEELLGAIRESRGPHSIIPDGDSDDQDSVGFRILGIPATFSVLAGKRAPERHYNVQIESVPQGDYLYNSRAISLWGLLELVELMSGPIENWP